jgi:hypothetical protein
VAEKSFLATHNLGKRQNWNNLFWITGVKNYKTLGASFLKYVLLLFSRANKN